MILICCQLVHVHLEYRCSNLIGQLVDPKSDIISHLMSTGGGDLLGTGERLFLQLRMNSLREEEDSEVLFYAALLGNTSVISDYLQKYPNEVCVDPSPLHSLLYQP